MASVMATCPCASHAEARSMNAPLLQFPHSLPDPLVSFVVFFDLHKTSCPTVYTLTHWVL